MTGSLFPRKIHHTPNIAHPFGQCPGKANYERNVFFWPVRKTLRLGVCSSQLCVETTLDYRLDSTTKDKIGKRAGLTGGVFCQAIGVYRGGHPVILLMVQVIR